MLLAIHGKLNVILNHTLQTSYYCFVIFPLILAAFRMQLFLLFFFFLCAKEESASGSWYPVSNAKAGSNENENTNICKNAALM